MKHLRYLLILLLTGCSSTFVYAPKSVCNCGDNNKTVIEGSDLKGNKQDKKSDSKLEIPFVK